MSWIAEVSYEAATGKLRRIFDRVVGPDGNVDNILLAHGLRPHTLEGHMALYKNVLHHNANTVPKWFLEALGVYVSILNRCDYCADHHYTGMARLIGDDTRSTEIRAALEAGRPEDAFAGADLAAMRYAHALTRDPGAMQPAHVDAMRDEGMDDGQILEVNQVCAYFAYANRTVLGLGITTDGETLGLSPNNSDDPDNWGHT